MYAPNKPYHRENFFQLPTNHITSTQNTIIGGDFNIATEFRERINQSKNQSMNQSKFIHDKRNIYSQI